MSHLRTSVKSAKPLSAKELAYMKETLGEILLDLQCPLTPEERQNLWQCFELLLERYVEAQKKRPLQGVNPKMLSSGNYHS